MGILLGLATALCWGSADLFARFATRKIGTVRTMLYMQLTGFALLTLALWTLGGWGHLADGSGWRPWAWGVLAGVLNTSSTLALYRSFEIGKMSVVAPLSASYPALTILLAALTGERLTQVRLVGIALIIVGAALVARGEKIPNDANLDEKGHPGRRMLGVGWALFSAVGFGVMFWLLGIRVVPLLGSAPSVWLIRLASVVMTTAVAVILRQPLALPQAGANRWILGVGILDTSAYVLNNYGMQHEQVSVVSVLASLYGAVTVGFASIFLGERVSRTQWMGVVSIFAGIFLISR
jgi:drug/metabolite transporter (DMT)-like permease